MNCQVFPRVEGIALQRFRALAKQVMQYQRAGESGKLEHLRRREVNWAKHEVGLNGAREEYEALARVLIDLAKLRWRVEEDRFGIELLAPSNISLESIADYKEMVRSELAPQLAEQFADESTRKFIRQMESPRPSSKKKPVTMLIADGGELRSRLLEAEEAEGPARLRILEGVVKPYLQLVEPKGRDQFTGQNLSDIWRYFRYTWTIPATNIPGRQLNYLIRDAGHPYHAIIGITALCNSPLQMRERDTALGWTKEAFGENVADALSEPNAPDALRGLLRFLEHCIDCAVAAVDWTNLVNEREVAAPTEEIVARLRRKAGEFASQRAEALKGLSEAAPLAIEELEAVKSGEPPVSDDVLGLEQKVFGDPALDKARRAMIAKKRAALLARALQARLTLRRHASTFVRPETTRATLGREDFESAVASALEGVKHLYVGSNLLEITTCGAVEPYNILLGGKLVALLMLSPEVADDYHRRYGSEPAIISSMMKNSRVIPDTRLVFLGTTSLYAHGASQYNRLRLPHGIIAPDQKEIRFEALGYTGGFGTVQFPNETTHAVRRVLERDEGFRNVNSIFGEGRSPKFRMMRAGLRLLGFDPETVMQHHQRRLIYGVLLCPQARDFLLARDTSLPSFIDHPEQFRDATTRIVSFWRERWLSRRIDHKPALELLRQTPTWRLSERIPVRTEQQAGDGGKPAGVPPSRAGDDNGVEFWRTFAKAGHSVCSDELPTAELDRLSVITSLEPFLIERVRAGFSLVLTGNAGDGKTHLLRRLAMDLRNAGADVDLDATALMRRDSVAPILNRWRGALAASRPYCLAANEYPLYLLRSELHRPNSLETLGSLLHKVLSEVDRQCNKRLAYGIESVEENAQEKILVVDLSLRNPLSSAFSGPALDRMLTDPALRKLADSAKDPDFAWNFFRISHPTVHHRLLLLFDRLVSRGVRCTVRELWILLARLFFSNKPEEARPFLSLSAWYSERLFETDPRFPLVARLKQDADPAGISHPQWDFRLEDSEGTRAEDWLVDGIVPTLDRRELEAAGGFPYFAALKRRFYFEHREGEQAFALESEDAKEFHDLLGAASEPGDMILRRRLIHALNRCYCPVSFPGSEEAFWLWIGHRFHEQPSKSFLANQSIPTHEFQVYLPRLPKRLEGAWDYHPDHLVLQYQPNHNDGEPCRLKIDFSLWSTLHKLGEGFPRHLASERELNRVDAFLDRLKRLNPPQSREFMIFNNQDRLATRIRLTSDNKIYEDLEFYR